MEMALNRGKVLDLFVSELLEVEYDEGGLLKHLKSLVIHIKNLPLHFNEGVAWKLSRGIFPNFNYKSLFT